MKRREALISLGTLLTVSRPEIPIVESDYKESETTGTLSIKREINEDVYNMTYDFDRYTLNDSIQMTINKKEVPHMESGLISYRRSLKHYKKSKYLNILSKKLGKVNSTLSDYKYTNYKTYVLFGKSIPYKTDLGNYGNGDYIPPLEQLLVKGAGDCEDKGFLISALLESLGFKTSLILLPNHLGVAVPAHSTPNKTYPLYSSGPHFTIDGKDYKYIEPTYRTRSGYEFDIESEYYAMFGKAGTTVNDENINEDTIELLRRI